MHNQGELWLLSGVITNTLQVMSRESALIPTVARAEMGVAGDSLPVPEVGP